MWKVVVGEMVRRALQRINQTPILRAPNPALAS